MQQRVKPSNPVEDKLIRESLSYPSYFDKNGSLKKGSLDSLYDDLEVEKVNQKTNEIIELLPSAIQKAGLNESAKYMHKWLTDPQPGIPYKVPPMAVSWDFLTSYERVNKAIQEIDENVKNDILGTSLSIQVAKPGAAANAVKLVQEKLSTLEGNGLANQRIYYGARTIGYVEGFIQPKSSHNSNSIPDDLAASLGRFALKLHLVGNIENYDEKKSAYPFSVSRYEISVRDTFDFSGWQPLGPWHKDGFGMKPGSVWLYNSSFRDYRLESGRGQDFDVQSEVKSITLEKPIKMYILPEN